MSSVLPILATSNQYVPARQAAQSAVAAFATPQDFKKLSPEKVKRLQDIVKPKTLTPNSTGPLRSPLIVDPISLQRRLLRKLNFSLELRGFLIEFDFPRLIGSAARSVYNGAPYNDIDFLLHVHSKDNALSIDFLTHHTATIIREALQDLLVKLYKRQHPDEPIPSRLDIFNSFFKSQALACDLKNHFALHKLVDGLEFKFAFNTPTIPGLASPCAFDTDLIHIKLDTYEMVAAKGSLEEALRRCDRGEITTDDPDGSKFCKMIDHTATRPDLWCPLDFARILFENFCRKYTSDRIRGYLTDVELSTMQQRVVFLNIAAIKDTFTEDERLERLLLVLKSPYAPQSDDKESFYHSFTVGDKLCCLYKFSLIEEALHLNIDLKLLVPHLKREEPKQVFALYENHSTKLLDSFTSLPFKEFFIKTCPAWQTALDMRHFASEESASLSFFNILQENPCKSLWDYSVSHKIFDHTIVRYTKALVMVLENDFHPDMRDLLGPYLPLIQEAELFERARKILSKDFTEKSIPYIKLLGPHFIQEHASKIIDYINRTTNLESLYTLMRGLQIKRGDVFEVTAAGALQRCLMQINRSQYELGAKTYLSFHHILKKADTVRLSLADKLMHSKSSIFIAQVKRLISVKDTSHYKAWIKILLGHHKVLNADIDADMTRLHEAIEFFIMALDASICLQTGEMLSDLLDHWKHIPVDMCDYLMITNQLWDMLRATAQTDSTNTIIFIKRCVQVGDTHFFKFAWNAMCAHNRAHMADTEACLNVIFHVLIPGIQEKGWLDSHMSEACAHILSIDGHAVEAQTANYEIIGRLLARPEGHHGLLDLIIAGFQNSRVCKIWTEANLIQPLLLNINSLSDHPSLLITLCKVLFQHESMKPHYVTLVKHLIDAKYDSLSPKEKIVLLIPILQTLQTLCAKDPSLIEPTFTFISRVMAITADEILILLPLVTQIISTCATIQHPSCEYFSDESLSRFRSNFMAYLMVLVATQSDGLKLALQCIEHSEKMPSQLLHFSHLCTRSRFALDSIFQIIKPAYHESLKVFLKKIMQHGVREETFFLFLASCAVHRIDLLHKASQPALSLSLMCVREAPMPQWGKFITDDTCKPLIKEYITGGNSGYPLIMHLAKQPTHYRERMQVSLIHNPSMMCHDIKEATKKFLALFGDTLTEHPFSDERIGDIVQNLFVLLNTRLKQLSKFVTNVKDQQDLCLMQELLQEHSCRILAYHCNFLHTTNSFFRSIIQTSFFFFLETLAKPWKDFQGRLQSIEDGLVYTQAT